MASLMVGTEDVDWSCHTLETLLCRAWILQYVDSQVGQCRNRDTPSDRLVALDIDTTRLLHGIPCHEPQ